MCTRFGGFASFALLLAVVAAGSSAIGCSTAGKAPSLPSSSGQTAYALGYDEELTSVSKAVSDAQTREKQLTAGFGAHVDELKRPDWDKVQTVITDSDEAGKSAGFADAQGEAGAIRGFWDSEKGEITGKVSGSAQYTMKQSGCTADVSGPVAYALNDAITKQLQKKLRSKNEAFIVLERYKTSLGAQNVASLEKLADDISEASYDVHALMVVQRNRLQRLVADRDEVKKTLDRFIEEETAFQSEAGRTEPERKASQDRIAAANKSKAEIDRVSAQADSFSKEMDKSIEAAKKDYDEALKALNAKVAEKRKAEGAPSSKAATTPRGRPSRG